MKDTISKVKQKILLVTYCLALVSGYLTAVRIGLEEAGSLNLSRHNGSALALGLMMMGYLGIMSRVLTKIRKTAPAWAVWALFLVVLTIHLIVGFSGFSQYQGPYIDPLGMLFFLSFLPVLIGGIIMIRSAKEIKVGAARV